MSFFRERARLLTGPVFTVLVLLFLFNVGAPSLTLSRTSHITIVDGDGAGTDGKPEEWAAPGVGSDPILLMEDDPVHNIVFGSAWRYLLRSLVRWI